MRGAHLLEGDDVALLEVADLAKGHHLDKAHFPVVLQRQPRQVDHVLPVVKVAHDHRN